MTYFKDNRKKNDTQERDVHAATVTDTQRLNFRIVEKACKQEERESHTELWAHLPCVA